MRQKPKTQVDSFWGDLVNALTLRPVYRPTVEAPQASKKVTLQSPAESASASEQRKAEEKARTAVQHEAREESTTAQTTAPVYRYLKEEQERSFAPTAPQEAEPELGWVLLGDSEYLLVNGTLIPRSTLDTLRDKVHPSDMAASQESQPASVQAKNGEVVVKETGSPLPPTNNGQYVVVDGGNFSAGSSTPSPSPPSETTGKRTVPNDTTGKRTIPNGSPDISQGRIRRILKPKLKASQLRGMGFSENEAAVLEGLYRGRKIRSIATRLPARPSQVLHIVKQLMGKMEAANMNSLLKKVWSLHRDSKQLSFVEAAGLKAIISDEPLTNEPHVVSGIVAVHAASLTERPRGINIPANHPDHPANDEGAKKSVGQEGKRTPAHSTNTPPPRKPE